MKSFEDLSIKEAQQMLAQADELAKFLGRPSPALSGPSKVTTIEEKRVVLVVDNGWIFAGDQTVTTDGYIRLARAVHVVRWESIGFAAVIGDPKDKKIDLRPCADVEVPLASIIFRVPVGASWGLL